MLLSMTHRTCLIKWFISLIIEFNYLKVASSSVAAPSMLLRDFFIFKRVEAIEIHTCSLHDSMKLARDLTMAGLQIMSGERSKKSIYRGFDNKYGIFIDTNCKSGVDFIYKASNLNAFNMSYCWLFWNKDFRNILNDISELQFGMTSDVSLAVPFPSYCHLEDCGSTKVFDVAETTLVSNDSYHAKPSHLENILLYDVYKTFSWTKLISQLLARWSLSGGLVINEDVTRLYDMGRTDMKAGLYIIENIYHMDNLENELQDNRYNAEHDIVNRYFYSLNLHMADLYNYSISLVLADGFGTKQKDGHFDGVVGLLERRVINMSLTGLQLLAVRLEASNFLLPLHYYKFPFVFKQPRALGTYRALSLQLQTHVWYCVGCILLVSVTVYRVVQKLHWKTNQLDEDTGVSAAAVQVVGIIAQQGLSEEPNSTSGRVVCTFVLLLALMVGIYYNAATMNALLSPAPASVRNLHELLSTKIPLVLMDVPYFTIKETRERLFSQAMIERVSPNYVSLEEGLKIILEGGAFCAEDSTLFTSIQNSFHDNEKCDLSVFPAFPAVIGGTYVTKNSPLRELFFRGNLRMLEHGLSDRQRKHWFPEKPSCSGRQVFLFVGLRAVTIATSIMLLGLCASTAIFLLELLINARIRRLKKDHVIKIRKQ